MLKSAVFVTCVLMVFADSLDKTSMEAQINTLRAMRRLQGIQKRGLMNARSSSRQRKDEHHLICNACSFSGGTTGCTYADEVCGDSQICADIWRSEGTPRNYNGCISPKLCQMIDNSKDNSYVRVECCDNDLCNW